VTATIQPGETRTGARPWAPAAFGAAGWAFAFALPHVYWGVGGTAGLTTALNREIVDGRDAGFLVGNVGIAAFCIAGGLVALAFVHPRAGRLPRGPLRALAWFGFLLLTARAVDIYLEFGLGLTGLSSIAADERAEFLRLAPWFLFLWLPWFATGAALWGTLAVRSATWRRP
jgi:hypothetical protein